MTNRTDSANEKRIEKRLNELSKFGDNPEGGINRVAYSDADIEGRNYIIGLMEEAGLKVKIDAAGNIIGRKEGKVIGLPAIALGSHTDTVPEGGKYDGALGVISALETVQTLKDKGCELNHPLEVIVFTDEEGTFIGSSVMTGKYEKETLEDMSHAGKTVREGIKFIGGDPDNLASATRKSSEIIAFIELHIEQGATLERKTIDIGVVEGIVGIRRWNIDIEGFANHAGTTPMDQRKDALLAASHFVIKVNEIARGFEGKQVATVGVLDVHPGVSNVIPGHVKLTLEIRDISEDKIQLVYDKIAKEVDAIARKTDTKFSIDPIEAIASPAMMNEEIKNALAEAAKDLEYTFMLMPSGAGHDAQNMAKLAPTGMIFVPSVGGVSHSPKEYTKMEFCVKGANVMLNTVFKLDEKMGISGA